MISRHSFPLKPALVAVAGLVGLLAGSAALADPIEVPLDQVHVLAFKVPVKTVFVGNPVIADITVIDPTHVFVLGKNFGTTNLVALDDKGHEFFNEQVTVLDRPGSTVTLQRGAAKTTLNCNTARCQAAPTPGDEATPYDSVSGQMEKREMLGSKAASGQ
ncbi:MAG TPA: pilus assembly protein N-terminal domain-containing protein [Micropepsaceae bacterium]|nr:pilus assembly protein N-terminal domain-containing protein [Micropepsaceae bacterium]